MKWKLKECRYSSSYKDNTDFKPVTVTGKTENNYTVIKELIHQEDTSLVNIYLLYIETPNSIKQILVYLKREIYSNIVIAENFRTLL